ncbi:MAG: class II aldolase/adducin family protein [Dehalococcoidia bacterium]
MPTPPLDVPRPLPLTPNDAPFAVWDPSGVAGEATRALRQVLKQAGHAEVLPADARVVLAPVDLDRPRPLRRAQRSTFVVAVVEVEDRPNDVLAFGYPFLVRALANLCVLVARSEPETAHVITLERGHYEVAAGRHMAADYSRLYEHLRPLALSRLVIDNDHIDDLPRELWQGDAATQSLLQAGARLDRLGLLPAPFPIAQYLSPRDLRHVQLLYGVGGLSYGNMSARRDADSFWMTASGVNKGHLSGVGRDLVLISGFDPERLALRLSEPPDLDRPPRASVDAIEHWMIYRRHAAVGAIVHVHTWIEGVTSTSINFPCGTIELASAVADLIALEPDPGRAIVGQKNHGLTITGPDLPDIFERLEAATTADVPMAA